MLNLSEGACPLGPARSISICSMQRWSWTAYFYSATSSSLMSMGQDHGAGPWLVIGTQEQCCYHHRAHLFLTVFYLLCFQT